MPSNPQIIVPGIDLSVISSPTSAQVDQAIRTAYPPTNVGGIVLASLAPDTVAYPLLAGFIWSETVDNTSYVPVGRIYTFNGTTWVLHQTSGGANIDDASITFDKLAVPGGSDALKIMRANNAGSGYELVPVLSTIDAGTFPISKLIAGGHKTMLIVDNAGVVTWFSYDSLIDGKVATAIVAAQLALTIPISKILPGSGEVGQVIGLQLVGSVKTPYWVNPDALIRPHTVTAAMLTPGASQGGKLLRVNPLSTAFDYVGPRALMDSLSAYNFISQTGDAIREHNTIPGATTTIYSGQMTPLLGYGVALAYGYNAPADLAAGTIAITISGKYIVTWSGHTVYGWQSYGYSAALLVVLVGIRINNAAQHPVGVPPTTTGGGYILDLVAGDTVSLMANANESVFPPNVYGTDHYILTNVTLSVKTL